MFGVSSGFIVMSDDKKPDSQPVRPQPTKRTVQPAKRAAKVPQPKLTPYIDLGGRLIKLETKAEETKAKKDGYKIVYQ